VYALPRAGSRVWANVIPVLLGFFEVQWYLEDKSPQASLWADFATSSRPHNMQELIGAVNDALAITIWYRPVWDLLTEQTDPCGTWWGGGESCFRQSRGFGERKIINVFF
jgi:hypothetical protein